MCQVCFNVLQRHPGALRLLLELAHHAGQQQVFRLIDGVPVKLMIASIDNFTGKDILALNYLEEGVLNLGEKLIPLNSSYTQSGEGEVGRPQTPDDELTDGGERSRGNSGG